MRARGPLTLLALAALLPLVMAPTSSTPSRPRFQAVGVNAPAPAAGNITASGTVTATNFVGTVRASDGTAPLPSVAFGSDLTTGLYRQLAGRIGFAAAGAQRVVIASTFSSFNVPVWVDDATAAAPSLSFNNDATKGFYSAGAGSIGIATAGVNRATIGPGMQLGAPTGGDQGAGALNATGLYVNGAAVAPTTTGTLTLTLSTGCTTNPTMIVRWQLTGQVVTLETTNIICTANNSTRLFGGASPALPAALRPSTKRYCGAMPMLDNATLVPGGLTISATGFIEAVGPTSWASTGFWQNYVTSHGALAQSCVYTL